MYLVYGPLGAVLSLPADADLVLRPAEGETTGYDLTFGDVDADGGDDLVMLGSRLDVLLGL